MVRCSLCRSYITLTAAHRIRGLEVVCVDRQRCTRVRRIDAWLSTLRRAA
jgi:hypothetical protein